MYTPLPCERKCFVLRRKGERDLRVELPEGESVEIECGAVVVRDEFGDLVAAWSQGAWTEFLWVEARG